MKIVKEFKEFAMRGNVIDLAVGIIIGAAFQKIVTSMVADVIMPPIGFLLSNANFSDITINMSRTIHDAAGHDVAKIVTLNIGKFIQAIIDFIIVAFCVFMMVKGMNSLKKKEESKSVESPKPSKEEVLLTEIRDLLKK